MTPTLRLTSLILATFVVAGCSELDCSQPMRYHGAKLEKRLTTPDGLQPLAARTSHDIPGGPPPEDFRGGACLVKPPQLVAVPEEKDD